MDIKETLEAFEEAYLICELKGGDFIHAEIQPADYWVGGPEDGFMDDSGHWFATPASAQAYYSREYKDVRAFEDKREMEEAWDKMGLEW